MSAWKPGSLSGGVAQMLSTWGLFVVVVGLSVCLFVFLFVSFWGKVSHWPGTYLVDLTGWPAGP